jgi:hypothetical protein
MITSVLNRWLPASLLIAASLLGPSAMAAAGGLSEGSCSGVALIGRVIQASYVELAQTPGYIDMDVLWTLNVAVKRVLQGSEPRQRIKVVAFTHAHPGQDRDIVFHRSRRADAEPIWEQPKKTCELQSRTPP